MSKSSDDLLAEINELNNAILTLRDDIHKSVGLNNLRSTETSEYYPEKLRDQMDQLRLRRDALVKEFYRRYL